MMIDDDEQEEDDDDDDDDDEEEEEELIGGEALAIHQLTTVGLVSSFLTFGIHMVAYRYRWTASSDEEFPAAEGALLGIGLSCVPATCVGIWVAFGRWGNFARRRLAGFVALGILPMGAMAAAVVPAALRGTKKTVREEARLFFFIAVIITGHIVLALWCLMATILRTRLIPKKTAALYGSWLYVLVYLPLGALMPLVLTRNNGRGYREWIHEGDSTGRPPLFIAAGMLLPYVGALFLVEPALKLLGGRRKKKKKQQQPSVASVRVVLGASLVGACLAAFLDTGEAAERAAVIGLAVLTPISLYTSAWLALEVGSTQHLWATGTWRLVMPTFFAGYAVLNGGKNFGARSGIAAACFGYCAQSVLVLFISSRRDSSPRRRFEASSTLVALGAFPWWFLVLAYLRHFENPMGPGTLRALALCLAAIVSCVGSVHATRVLWAARVELAPRRLEVLAGLPPLALLLSLCYLILSIDDERVVVGGSGVIAASVVFAPLATYGQTVPPRRRARVYATCWVLALATQGVCVILTANFESFRAERYMVDKRSSALLSKLKAGSLWLLAIVPCAHLAWTATHSGAAVWRISATLALAKSTLIDALQESYYAGLLLFATTNKHDDEKEEEEEEHHRSRSPWLRRFLQGKTKASFKKNSKEGLLEIRGEEALPAFSTLLCLLVLVPFGVLAPAAFVSREQKLFIFTKNGVVAYLGLSVVAGVTIITTAANASMERIKAEERAKVAVFALRLDLRRTRVIASRANARAMHEARENHARKLEIVLDKQQNKSEGRARLAADAADAALRNDMLASKARVEELIAQKEAVLHNISLGGAGVLTPREAAEEEARKTTGIFAHMKTPRRTWATKKGKVAPLVASDETALLPERAQVYWRSERREPGFMSLVTLGQVEAEITHEREKALKKRRKEEQAASPSLTARSTASSGDESPRENVIPEHTDDDLDDDDSDDDDYDDAESLHHEDRHRKEQKDDDDDDDLCLLPLCSCTKEASPLLWCFARCKGPEKVEPLMGPLPPPPPTAQQTEEDLRRAETLLQRAAATLEAGTRHRGGALADPRAALKARAARRLLLPLKRAEVACLASERWGLLRRSLPRLVGHAWSLVTPSAASTNAYRQSLLPRTFAFYARPLSSASEDKQSLYLSKEGWRDFLKAADLISEGKITLAKADLVHTALAGQCQRRTGLTVPDLVDYAHFRQSMRLLAQELYPEQTEAESLKNLGQKHVFPRVKMRPAAVAQKAGLLSSDEEQQPRLMDFLQRGPPFLRVLEKQENRSTIVRDFKEAREALEALDMTRVGEEPLRAGDVAAILANRLSTDSREARQLRALEAQAAEDERARLKEAKSARHGLLGLFFWSNAKPAETEAEEDLALLKAAAEAAEASVVQEEEQEVQRDWSECVEVVVKSLRAADDVEHGDNEGEQSVVIISRNMDNGFALLEVVTEVVTYASVAMQGAGAYAWHLERDCAMGNPHYADCEEESDTSDSKSLISRAAALPLGMTDQIVPSFDHPGLQFWVVVCLCLCTPLYLRRGVQAAREQRIGLAADGKKMKLLSVDFFYFNGIKLLYMAFVPLLTTLFSVFFCENCEEPNLARMSSVKCTSWTHLLYLFAGLAALLCYYPLMAYIQPQLQFKSKDLDLKFEPVYLVVAAQCKLALALAVNFFSPERFCKSQVDVNKYQNSFFLLILLFGITLFLSVYTIKTRPCIVPEFNVVRASSLMVTANFVLATIVAFLVRRNGYGGSRICGGVIFVLAGVFVVGCARLAIRELRVEENAKKEQPAISPPASPPASPPKEEQKKTKPNAFDELAKFADGMM